MNTPDPATLTDRELRRLEELVALALAPGAGRPAGLGSFRRYDLEALERLVAAERQRRADALEADACGHGALGLPVLDHAGRPVLDELGTPVLHRRG